MVIAQGYEICHLLIDLIYFRYVYLLFQSPYFKAQHPSQEPTLLEKYYIESITVNLIMCFYLPLKRYFLEDSSTKKFGKSTIAQIEELNNSQNDYSPITEPTLLYKMFIKYKKSKDLLTLWSLVSAKCSIFLLLGNYLSKSKWKSNSVFSALWILHSNFRSIVPFAPMFVLSTENSSSGVVHSRKI